MQRKALGLGVIVLALLLLVALCLPSRVAAQIQAQAVYLTNRAGVEQSLVSDAAHGGTVATNGPQGMGACNDALTGAVTQGQAARLRLDCEWMVLLTEPVGLSSKRYLSVGVTEDESQVKATAGVLMGVSARNANAGTAAFLKCTNATAASTTPGATAIVYEMEVPPAGLPMVDRQINQTFSVALTCYIVTGKTDADATEVAAGDVSYNLTYK